MSDRLINLREITVFGGIQHGGAISTNAISALAKNLPAIESLSFIGVETLQPCFSQFAGIRYLTVFAVNAKGIADLTHEQARDIAATHGLEILSIGNYRLDNDSISILAEADDLRHLDLVRTSAKSETGLELELEKVRPQISIRILQ